MAFYKGPIEIVPSFTCPIWPIEQNSHICIMGPIREGLKGGEGRLHPSKGSI